MSTPWQRACGFAAAIVGLASLISIALALAPGTSAAAGPDRFAIGFADGLMSSADPATRALWQDRTVDAGASLLRINLPWRQIVSDQPVDPSDPADPAYALDQIDAAVLDADARGLEVMLTIFSAPAFAETERPPGSTAPAGTYRPDPEALGEFATALARRYSGSFSSPIGILPQVRYLQAWLEPNLTTYLSPQWNGQDPASPAHYRAMLNAFYAGAKQGNPAVQVVGAGTAPYGDDPGNNRMRPLYFWRQVLCLRDDLKPARACPTRDQRPQMDVFAHHPINTSGGPGRAAIDPDDATGADFGELAQTLRRAEQANLIQPPGHRPLWATEFWWESDPPDAFDGFPPARQARFIEQTLFQLWSAGASAGIMLQIRDDPYDPANSMATLQSGLYYLDDTPKPALQAVEFPFVVSRKGESGALAWGIAPETGKVKIAVRASGRWRALASTRVAAGDVFTARLPDRRRGAFRASIDSRRSLTWQLGG